MFDPGLGCAHDVAREMATISRARVTQSVSTKPRPLSHDLNVDIPHAWILVVNEQK